MGALRWSPVQEMPLRGWQPNVISYSEAFNAYEKVSQ